MLASERPAFGQVWRYNNGSVTYLLVAPDPNRPRASAWLCLYLGAEGAAIGGAAELWKGRIANGRSLFDSMAGLPADDPSWHQDPAWERVE